MSSSSSARPPNPAACPQCGSTNIRATLETEHEQYYLCDECASIWSVSRAQETDVDPHN